MTADCTRSLCPVFVSVAAPAVFVVRSRLVGFRRRCEGARRRCLCARACRGLHVGLRVGIGTWRAGASTYTTNSTLQRFFIHERRAFARTSLSTSQSRRRATTGHYTTPRRGRTWTSKIWHSSFNSTFRALASGGHALLCAPAARERSAATGRRRHTRTPRARRRGARLATAELLQHAAATRAGGCICFRLLRLDEHCVSPDLLDCLLGRRPLVCSPCRVVDACNLRAVCTASGVVPDDSQFEVLRDFALRTRLSLIQGPPGTGKSTMIGLLLLFLAGRRLGQTLACANSNVAVDRLATCCAARGVSVLRLVSTSREEAKVPEQASLAWHIARIGSAEAAEYRVLEALRLDHGGTLHGTHKNDHVVLRARLEFEVIRSVSVVCCTCSMSGSPRLRDLTFPHVVIDEATQSEEPQALVPVVRGCAFLVLVGDHCQLGPVVPSAAAAAKGLATSLFERLVFGGHPFKMLRRQYRMHPSIAAFPNAEFYEGAIENGVSDTDCTCVALPGVTGHLLWWHTASTETSVRKSFSNPVEAERVVAVVTHLLSLGVSSAEVGVIAPYDAQRVLLLSLMRAAFVSADGGDGSPRVDTVESFQGSECDYIIFSAVRSNPTGSAGFVDDRRRLNVALTRSRRGIVLVGDVTTLSASPMWRRLAHHYSTVGALLCGEDISSLSVYEPPLSAPPPAPASQPPAAVSQGGEENRGSESDTTAPAPPQAAQRVARVNTALTQPQAMGATLAAP